MTYGDYRDQSNMGHGETVVEALISSAYGAQFLAGLRTIRQRCNPHESIHGHWWYAPFIYIEVVDRRYGEFPASLRFNVSFDLMNGKFASLDSENESECARKGWGRFADRFIGRKANYYKSAAKFAKLEVAA